MAEENPFKECEGKYCKVIYNTEENINKIDALHVLDQKKQEENIQESIFIDWGFYSYMKTTQRDDSAGREDKRSGIFESFIQVYNDKDSLMEFMATNKLKFVVRTIPESFYDDVYFPTQYKDNDNNG
jgi:hypothetical protein